MIDSDRSGTDTLNKVLVYCWRVNIKFRLLSGNEFVKVSRRVSPADKELLPEVKPHAFYPFTDSLELVVAPVSEICFIRILD